MDLIAGVSIDGSQVCISVSDGSLIQFGLPKSDVELMEKTVPELIGSEITKTENNGKTFRLCYRTNSDPPRERYLKVNFTSDCSRRHEGTCKKFMTLVLPMASVGATLRGRDARSFGIFGFRSLRDRALLETLKQFKGHQMQTVITANRNTKDQALAVKAVRTILAKYDISQPNNDGSIRTSMSSDRPERVEFALLHSRFTDWRDRSKAIKKTLEQEGWTVSIK